MSVPILTYIGWILTSFRRGPYILEDEKVLVDSSRTTIHSGCEKFVVTTKGSFFNIRSSRLSEMNVLC